MRCLEKYVHENCKFSCRNNLDCKMMIDIKILKYNIGRENMKIRNKFSRQKVDRKKLFENKIINVKKKIRLKTSKIIPLSDMEKFLYTDFKDDYFEKNTKIPEEKYIRINDIFLLNVIDKKDCKQLYAGLINLYKDNYLKGYLGGELRVKELKKCIYDYGSLSNYNRWTKVVDLSPKDKELLKLCDFIQVSIFEISKELIGIVFDLKVNETFNLEINEIFNENVEIKMEYEKIRSRKSYVYSKGKTSVTETRKSDYENYILEFKYRFNKLFSKYLPLQLRYTSKAPISINIYQTNFNVKDRKEKFYTSLGILDDFSARECKDINTCIREKGKSDTFIKTTMWYNIMIERNKIDRSNNVLFYIEDPKYTIIHSSSDFVNMFIATLSFYLLDEMQEDLTMDKNELYNCKSGNVKKNYKQYEKLNLNYHKYSSIFNGFDIHRIEYQDEYLKKGFEHIKELYVEYNEQLDEIKKEYEFRTSINNIKSTYILSTISVIIAIIALISSVFFEYRKNDKNITSEKDNNCISETIESNK